METCVNYWAILIGAVLSMGVGAFWYGPLFGDKWLEIIGIERTDLETIKDMQKGAMPLYGLQFSMTLFQIMILAFLVSDTNLFVPIEKALWIWIAFVIPTLAGSVMWTNKSIALKRAQFFIQAGYQLIMFVIYGALLQYWP